LRIAEAMAGPAREPLGARVWTFEWLGTPNARLYGRCPDDLLDTPEELEHLKELLRDDDPDARHTRDAD
jgi:hypothetical protein